jgi:hypothetical protein
MLPLRFVPLKIENFTPTRVRDGRRSSTRFAVATSVQEAAIDHWNIELERHYSAAERNLNIADVPLRVCL